MMSFIIMMLFLMPLCYLSNFWFLKNLLVLMSFMFMFKFPLNYFSNISMIYGFDCLSYFLMLLSLWIIYLMFMASYKIYLNNYFLNLFSILLMMLLFSLFMVFCSINMFSFYLFFEFSLIPTLLIILGWGYQPERIQAGMYLFFYTMMASLPMMIFLFFYYKNLNTLSFNFMDNEFNLLMFFMLNMVFFVKIPMFMVHLWLPKAHVEAPVSGSMILAGIMLKLGGYGLMRFMVLFMSLSLKFNFILINFSLLGSFLISVICMRQSDMKSLIAYSSVVHMGLMLSSLLSLKLWSFKGSIIMMIAHGLCSSGLFVLANLNYERFMSRSIWINKGMINIMPSLSLWWFLLVSSNMAAPPSLNLAGEIMLINGLLSYSFIFMFLIMLLSFFSAAYSLYLYSFIQHGKYFNSIKNYFNISLREFLLLFLHWFPLNLFFLKLDLFIL
uniref:NADH-ubiquinone oxidoreductase chain 4 n=1 Tax=Nephus voeltzkowi TaxID=2233631 RepID=A0A6M3WDB7_9CUCU|nr:NADH dehydrogenase subunit 4 [Nephus voeltzkowi]QJF72933.1 NADH dehydrogenase subunit 4 [Nephus voeltzkowi]